ncbi:MAG: tetratricopeptide repeat protein [Anaerolineaceae bacterium]|nr:tetratricopeptide repeat protein [Anaerolineaceae bacterium]
MLGYLPMPLKTQHLARKITNLRRDDIYVVRLISHWFSQHSILRTQPFFRLVTRNLLLATFLLSACTLTEQQPAVIYVTATPPPATDGPSPIPPTPTIPPSPTVPPEVAIQLANQYLTNGYYEKAVAAYQAVIANASASPTVGASAGYGLGRAALKEGLFQDAVNALTNFITQFPNDPRNVQAYFLRGDAYLGLSQWQPAIDDFKYYLSQRPGMIDSYVDERIADAQLALGQKDAALASYKAATDTGRSLVPLLALREKVAQVLIASAKPQDALAQYEAILAVAKNNPYRANIEFHAAQTLIDGGANELGLDRMQKIFDTYPTTPEAYRAMKLLLAAKRDVDDYQRGQVSYNYGDYQDAIDSFTRFTTQNPLSSIPANLHLLVGRAYREIGNNSAANVAFQIIVDSYKSDPLFGAALLEQGRTKFLGNDIPGAIDTYFKIADTYNYLPEAAEALWRVGYLYGTNDNPGESRKVFERLADAYPNSEQARSGLFLAASAASKMGDPVGAERLYARLATTTTGDDQAAAYFWVGKLAGSRGDQDTAKQAYQLATAASPDSYFSARASDILAGRDSFAKPTGYTFQFDDAAQITEAENWMRQQFAIKQDGALWPLSPKLQTDARLIRGNELWTVGANAEAEVEFGDVIDDNENDGLASYQLAIFLRGIEAYYPSVLASANVIRAAKVGTLEAPAYLARLRYPAYYSSVIIDVSQRQKVDPLLLLSLIRHESLFNTYATAAAGEKGLTQVIPATAQYIAEQLNWPNYQNSDLFRPYVGIEFGAFFLAENLQRFDGNVQAALAGYNAGPGRAMNWLDLSGGDPDQFMTAITIDSTRTYVQRIYGFYSIYRSLYGKL